MQNAGALSLVVGGTLTAVAAVAHLACIMLGAPAYRFMGAGERIARAAEAGRIEPALVTVTIAAALCIWSVYAFSGAGVVRQLPFTNIVLPLVCIVFLARAFGFPFLKPMFPENSSTFWLISSAICLLLGVLYAVGTVYVWKLR